MEVTAQDGAVKRTYTVAVIRAASPIAKLKRLEIEGVKLSPGFTPRRLQYRMTVKNSTKMVRIRAIGRESGKTEGQPLKVGNRGGKQVFSHLSFFPPVAGCLHGKGTDHPA